MKKPTSLLKIRYELLNIRNGVYDKDIKPTEPPHPPVKIFKGDSSKILLPAYLAWDMRTSTIRLAENALIESGGYTKGFEAPEDSIAYSTGAILTAFATIEAYVNETITIHAEHNRRKGPLKLFRRGYMEQSILTRFESLFIVLGIDVDWSKEPYQSLKLLYAVRNALVHHEGEDSVIAAKGFYPKKSLKDVINKINSPYIDDRKSPHHWHTHVLTPNGAVWATNTMLKITQIIDNELDS